MITITARLSDWQAVDYGGNPCGDDARYYFPPGMDEDPDCPGYSLIHGVIRGYAEHLTHWAVRADYEGGSTLLAHRSGSAPLDDELLRWASDVVACHEAERRIEA